MTQQPMDQGNQPINVLGFFPGRAYQVPFTTSSSNTSPEFSHVTSVITLYSDKDCFIQPGNSDVAITTSNGHFLPASTMLDVSLGGGAQVREFFKYIAVIGSTESGTLYVSERK